MTAQTESKFLVYAGQPGPCLSTQSYHTLWWSIVSFYIHREEVLWLYQEGASYIFPDRWERFIAPIPVVERGDMMSAYYRRLVGDNEEVNIAITLFVSTLSSLSLCLYTSCDLGGMEWYNLRYFDCCHLFNGEEIPVIFRLFTHHSHPVLWCVSCRRRSDVPTSGVGGSWWHQD